MQHYFSPRFSANAARSSPTLNTVVRLVNLRGLGIFPFLIFRQTVADEMPHKAMTIGSLTFAISGSKSNCCSADKFLEMDSFCILNHFHDG